MKRELAALAVLALLCTAAVWNVLYVRGVTEELCAGIETSRDCYEQGDWEQAETHLRRTIHRWLQPGSYIAVSLRHAEIDAITDDFYDLLSHLCAQADEARGGYEHLLTAVRRLAEMETPSLGSIF